MVIRFGNSRDFDDGDDAAWSRLELIDPPVCRCTSSASCRLPPVHGGTASILFFFLFLKFNIYTSLQVLFLSAIALPCTLSSLQGRCIFEALKCHRVIPAKSQSQGPNTRQDCLHCVSGSMGNLSLLTMPHHSPVSIRDFHPIRVRSIPISLETRPLPSLRRCDIDTYQFLPSHIIAIPGTELHTIGTGGFPVVNLLHNVCSTSDPGFA